MSEPFDFPSSAQQGDPHDFNMWLAMTLQRMSIKLDEVASLQRIANGRTSKLETKVDEIESAHVKHAGVIKALETTAIAVLSILGAGLIGALGTWVYSGGLVR